jgi:hypothetical protein
MVEQCVRFIATAWLKSKETEAFLRQLTEERIRKLSLQLALDGVSKRDDALCDCKPQRSPLSSHPRQATMVAAGAN